MPQTNETLAASHTETVPTGLAAGVPHLLWESDVADAPALADFNSCIVRCSYESFSPDPNLPANQPFDHELLFKVLEKQANGDWVEVGRQNAPIRKLDQGASRTIVVSPDVAVEEGVDQAIAGFSGSNEILKSAFRDATEGDLKVQLWLCEKEPDTPNALDSVTFSVYLKRYGN